MIKESEPQKFYSWKEAFEAAQVNSPDYFEFDGTEDTNYLHYLEEHHDKSRNK